MVSIDVRPIRSKKGFGRFLEVPHVCQGHDPAWVPPLRQMVRDQLNSNKNPWFRHGEAVQWIAEKDGALAGRISAQIDQSHLRQRNDSTGFFGFFECLDDQDIADALFETALGWLKDKGMKRAVGPFSLNINEESGLLVDGFVSPPKMMMGHAQPYYQSLVEGAGFGKVKDMLAFMVPMETVPPLHLAQLRRSSAGSIASSNSGQIKTMRPKPMRVRRSIAASDKYEVRHLNPRRYVEDIRLIVDIFNATWADNWGFIPLTEEDADHLASEFKPLLIPELAWIAFYEGEPAAMAVCLPDLNEMIADLGGCLLPTGWAKLAWRMLNRRSWSSRTRVPLMGVVPRFKNKYLGSALSLLVIGSIRDASLKLNLPMCEMSWVLENNTSTIRSITEIGGRVYKTYRIYEKLLA